jgi:hypothetical protein
MTVCEDLATKAEVQELRDQLNAVLGEKEDGSQAEVFTAGGGIAGGLLLSASTMLGFAKKNAPKAITQITMTKGVANGFAFGLPEGKAVLEALKADGQKVPQQALNEIGEQIGKNKAVGSTGAAVASNGAASLMLLATLVQIAGTLALNKATVDIFDARVNAESAGVQQALNQQNASMLRLYDKHEGELDAVNQDIERQNEIIASTQQQIAITQSDIVHLNGQTSTLANQLTEANQTIQELKANNVELASQVNGLETELGEAKAQFIDAITKVETQLDAAIVTIEKMQLDAQKQSERITLLETTVANQQAMLEEHGIDIANLQANVTDLQEDIELLQEEDALDDQIAEIKSKLAESKLIIEQYRLEGKRKAGNGSGAAIGGAAAAQTGVLQLANKLTTPDPNAPVLPDTITREEMLNNPETFGDRLQDLLDRVTPDTMTPEQLEDLRGNIKTDFNTGINAAIASLLVPNLVDIKQQTSPDNISAATQMGLCKSLNGGNCPPSPGNPNPVQGLKGMQDNLALKIAQAADLAQGAAILGYVKNTNQVINNAKYGLKNIQNFAETAWKATHADKVLSLANTALNIHNGIMLSNNIGRSMAYIADNVLATFGIKDATTGNPIDVGSFVRNKLNSMINQVLGATQANALRRQLAAYNRIYQAGANVLYNVRSIMDSTYDIAETTGENVSQIGNALRKAGTVRENAYKLMPTNFRSPSRVQRRLEKFGNAVETIEQVSSDAVDITTEVKEMKSNQKEFDDELAKVIDGQSKEAENGKRDATSNPEHSEEDEIRAIPKEKNS